MEIRTKSDAMRAANKLIALVDGSSDAIEISDLIEYLHQTGDSEFVTDIAFRILDGSSNRFTEDDIEEADFDESLKRSCGE